MVTGLSWHSRLRGDSPRRYDPAMTGRPATLIAAAVMLIVIGISGVAAGADFLALPASDLGSDVIRAGLAMGALIAGYGAAATIAGIGVVLRRRWAWWLGVATMLGGLGLLVFLLAMVRSLDAVVAFGIIVWGVTLALLLAPATRRGVR